MTTRDYDIAKIQEHMKSGYISNRKGNELIEKMWNQTKDADIEDRRKKLIEDQKEHDRRHRMVREDPEHMSKSELQHAINYFNSNPYEF